MNAGDSDLTFTGGMFKFIIKIVVLLPQLLFSTDHEETNISSCFSQERIEVCCLNIYSSGYGCKVQRASEMATIIWMAHLRLMHRVVYNHSLELYRLALWSKTAM